MFFRYASFEKMKETLNQVSNTTLTTTWISQELTRKMSERHPGLSHLTASIPYTLQINSETSRGKSPMLASLYIRVLHAISPSVFNACSDRGLTPADATYRDGWLHYQHILKLSLVLCGGRSVHSHMVFLNNKMVILSLT